MSYYEDQMQEYFDDGQTDDCITSEEIYKHGSASMWTTASGEYLPITDMSDRHLQNTIKYLERAVPSQTNKAWMQVMSDELTKRLPELED